MGEQNPIPLAAPKSLDPAKRSSTCPQTPSCDEKLLPRYLMSSQGSCHDLCKTQRKMDTVSSLTFLTSNENILSRYLVPSQSSCHDMCKYGHKHESEEASRKHPFFSRDFGNNQNEGHDQMNFISVKHRQKSDLMSVLNQKSEIKSKTGQTIDLPHDKIIVTSNLNVNLAEGSVEAPSSLELISPINDRNIITSLDNSAATKVDESIENGIGQHELDNTEAVLVHTPVAGELVRTASEFSFHNDALISEVGESPKKLTGLKSMVSSAVKGNTEFEHERTNPFEIFSVEHTSMELICPTPITDDIVLGECQTPNGEKESYNKLIGNKETVHRLSKEPLSLKLKNYKSKESTKQRPSREELASKRPLGTKLKTPLELERIATQNVFSFHNDAVITEVDKSTKKIVDLKSMVSSTAKGKIDSEYERAKPLELFSVEQTSLELISPTPFTDDIMSGECQTSNGEEESYNKLIDDMIGTVDRSSKETSSLKLKNYTSKESTKQRPNDEELASKRALDMKLTTTLELERTTIQNEFFFHNDVVITEVDKSTRKLIDLKSMVSSTTKGKIDSEYERENPSEVFSAEHTSMELIPPTRFTDNIVPSECQTSNGEEEFYNKLIDGMIGTVDRSSKEPSSLKLKNYKSKESAKQRSSREELASKRALGTKLKAPLELERRTIQNEFSFQNNAVIIELDKSSKKLIDLKSMVSSTTKGKIDSKYERANLSGVFSVEHTNIELIPPTQFTDDIAPGECQTSNGEKESYNKPIDNMMETVLRSSKEPSSLKLKNYKSKEYAKKRSRYEELVVKRPLGMKLKTPLELERTTTQNEFSFHNDAVITEVGKSSKKLIDLNYMVSSTAERKTDSEYEKANPSEVFSVEHTSMELIPPTLFTDDIVLGECQTSNGEEQSYNKPIDNMIGIVDRSSKEPSSLKLNSYKSKESAKQRSSHEELASKQALGMKLKMPLGFERTAIQNEFSFHNDATIAEVGESPKKLIDFMVSSTIKGNIDFESERANPSEVFLVEHTSMELIPSTPITGDIVLGECQTSNGEEGSYNKPMDNKIETVHQSSKGPSKLKLKKCTSKESAKERPSREELASKQALGMRLKAPLIQKTHGFNISTPQASFSQHIHLKTLSIHDKKNRELNKPKIRIKEIGNARRHKVVELQRYALNGPNVVKVNSALKKAIKVVKSESNHDNPSIAFDSPKVIINSISSPSKSNNKATKAITDLRKKKVLETSSTSSIYSKGVSGQRKQEKEKIIKVPDNLQNATKEVIEPLSTPSSSKPQFTRVPSFKLRKNVTIAPSFTMNNQAKARKTFVKEKNIRANEPNPEKIDLKALRQKLRKLGSFSDRKKEHAASGSQRSGGNEPFWLKEVSQARRTFRVVPKIERRSRSRRTSFDSEDRVGSSLKLNFSRGKLANLHPNSSSPPAWFTFRQNAKISPTKSFRNRMKSDVGGTSTSPSKSIKVVLRHKHADDKKVEKNLLNRVIEETASKLVESRKSKVKALVGAFETVISLQ